MSPNILVVDDSATVRNVLKTYLTNLKADFLGAEDAARALQLLREVPVSLVIADVNMPGMDGITFVSKLRASDIPQRAVPVVLITAEKGDELRQRGLNAGADAFLQKPISNDNLRDVVNRLLPGLLADT